MQEKLYDAIIIGGGPAGLSAALILGRCLRKVLLFDAGEQRNRHSEAIHGVLSRDGTNPLEFLRISKEQLEPYKVDILPLEVTGAKALESSFEIRDANNNLYYSKKLLLATGLQDEIPPLDGIEKLYGKSVFHCPYCDAFEMRLKPIAVVGYKKSGVGTALTLSNWTNDIILCTNGTNLTEKEYEQLELKNIRLHKCAIDRLEGRGGQLTRIVFTDGTSIERSGLFFASKQIQRSEIARQLGCSFTNKGLIKTGKLLNTSVHGVYVAGDLIKDFQMVATASADGLRAGIVIHKALQKEESSLKFVESFFSLYKHFFNLTGSTYK